MARDLAAQAPTTSTAPRVVINYTHRGLTNEKYNSKRKRQSYLPPINANRVLRPHEDALISTLGISGQMGLPSSTLENSRQILYGFNGATTTSLGDVVLPVQVGPVTSNMQFLVMVSYLIEDGQINLLSNQLATCHCYQVVLESGHPINNEPCPEPSNVDEQ
ncbi:hypothetical protein CK203_055539 [Vitis vinifera]|uniref:Uncharacterized protein n=1 Tax=Vitis vinifera TaxID=29760 RepID=A0A438GXP2_VITVI|nr:hypothetical protein CK203_055539 [Vitis vinifera]